MIFKHRRLDILAALAWSLLAGIRLAALISEPSLLQANLLLFNLIVMALFVLRRRASVQGPRRYFWLALAAALLPMLALRPAEAGWPTVGVAIQNVGLALMLVAIVALNRSFGLAPAHRGLVTYGPYRVVRHPLYAAELIHVAGYWLGYASIWNGVVWIVLVAAQLVRIRAEEDVLSTDSGYLAYQAQVRWRLLPGVW